MSKPIAVIAPETIKFADLPDIHALKGLKPGDRGEMQDLLGELAVVMFNKSQAEAREKEIKADLELLQRRNNLYGLRYKDWCFYAKDTPGKKTLNKVLLLEAGVEADVIEACMKPGRDYVSHYFRDLSESAADGPK